MNLNETARQPPHRRSVKRVLALLLCLVITAGAVGQGNTEFELIAVRGVGIGE